jgi:AcrR family transcriptional regulator
MRTSVNAGRPTGFDTGHALDVAMRLFWEWGYEGTSMADLSQKMGIHPSSIYAAFGDKQTLFALAAQRYADFPAQYMTSPHSGISFLLHSTTQLSSSVQKNILRAASRSLAPSPAPPMQNLKKF